MQSSLLSIAREQVTKENSRIMFRISIVTVGREASGSLIPDGLRQSAKEGIYFGTVLNKAARASVRFPDFRFAISSDDGLLYYRKFDTRY